MLFRSVSAAALLAAAGVCAAQPYAVTLNSAASNASWSFSLSAPYQTSPANTCNILGNWDSVNNPGGTRTIPGLFGGDTNANTPVNISAGSVGASASSGANPLHPAGSFTIALDTGAGTCAVSDFTSDILNGATTSGSGSASITYSSFRTRQPTCTILGGFPITVPLGNAEITALTATQDTASAPGSLSSAGGGAYNFNVPLTATANITASLNGAAFPVDPTPVAFVLSGTITPNGSTATMSAEIHVNQQDSQAGPLALDPISFTEPLCSGNLIVTLVLASVDTGVTIDSNMSGSGVLLTPPCDPDVNCDGSVNGFDIEATEQAINGDYTNFCQPSADLNADGAENGFDIETEEQRVNGAPC
ncbi:hypothetical protein PHYC_03398 [Phycisphaerales bacterium]|nr:hypothetical protein PHYC_03398 [Phycisphaerales bacterium]